MADVQSMNRARYQLMMVVIIMALRVIFDGTEQVVVAVDATAFDLQSAVVDAGLPQHRFDISLRYFSFFKGFVVNEDMGGKRHLVMRDRP